VSIPAPPRRRMRSEDQALLEQWLNQELDWYEQELNAEDQSTEAAHRDWLARHLSQEELDRHEQEITAAGGEYQAWLAKHPRRYALHVAKEKRDFGPMKELVKKLVREELGDEFARLVRLPKRRGKGADAQEYLDARPQLKANLRVKTRGVWEARRAQAIMKHKKFKGYEPRTYWKVAAARAGLTVDAVDELRDFEKNCPADPWPVILPP
jgi:hypothetical protein